MVTGKPRPGTEITGALSQNSGVTVKPRIAKSYPEILKAFSTGDANLVYVGSFVQAIIKARGLGTPLAQTINGKELYDIGTDPGANGESECTGDAYGA